LGATLAVTVAAILAAHWAGTITPAETVARGYARIRAHGDDAIFITLRPEAEAVAEASAGDHATLRVAIATR
jgi:allophanate hydrolase